jgi:hypothetical protein
MVKTSFVKSTIEIWRKDYVNDLWRRTDEDKDAEIVQIEHAYDDLFMVEIVRKEDIDNVIIHDSGCLENIMLCRESNENKKNM